MAKEEIQTRYIEELCERINKAINKLYSWGEALDPKFQKEMLDILLGKGNEKMEYSLEEQMKINKKLQQRIDKTIEYMNSLEFFELMNSKANTEDYFKAKEKIISILQNEEVK